MKKNKRSIKILAIETSCDDTGVAVLEVSPAPGGQKFRILSNVVSSQTEIHKKWGGVWPTLAKREHQKNLVPVLIKALEKAGLLKSKESIRQLADKIQNPNKILGSILEREPELLKKLILFFKKYEKPEIDLISVTNGPGLEPCLWVGINFAKALSCFWDIPVVPVNHIESHILVNLLENRDIKFPAIALVVSGGHTQIILMEDPPSAKIGGGGGKYKILGETRDDAAGECFDKCAKILGLGYPGGPIISKLAKNIKTQKTFPRPMIGTKDYDFSFSGLKTAVLYADRRAKNRNQKYKKEMAAEVQQAIIDVLIKKTIKAAKDYKAKTIILGGGVTANEELRSQFASSIKHRLSSLSFLVPPKNLSTDNAAMAAVAGYFGSINRKTKKRQDIRADSNLKI